MPKYEVRVTGHTTRVTNYHMVATVEAATEEEACNKARDLADDNQADWVETDMTCTADYDEIQIDDVEVESEIEDDDAQGADA